MELLITETIINKCSTIELQLGYVISNYKLNAKKIQFVLICIDICKCTLFCYNLTIMISIF